MVHPAAALSEQQAWPVKPAGPPRAGTGHYSRRAAEEIIGDPSHAAKTPLHRDTAARYGQGRSGAIFLTPDLFEALHRAKTEGGLEMFQAVAEVLSPTMEK
jgi:hypothetical protein